MATSTTPPPTGNDVAGSAFFKKFLRSAEGYLRQPTRLKQLLADAYRKASEKNELGTLAHEAWTTLQTLFRLIRASVSGEYTGVPGTTVAAAVAVLIYFLSPVDLIPDFIPVVGLLDDVALVAWFSTTVKHELDKFEEWEKTRPALVEEKHSTHTASAANSPAAHNQTANAMNAQPQNESAKRAGLTDLPSAPAGTHQSATDAGLGSPSSHTTEPVQSIGPDGPLPTPDNAGQTQADDIARTTDSSREGNVNAQNDAGGNVR